MFDGKIRSLNAILNLKNKYNGHMVDYEGHVVDNNTAMMTTVADRYWSRSLESKKHSIFFNTGQYKLKKYQNEIKEEIDELIDIIESNIIENNIEYSLKENADNLNEIKENLNNELNKTIEKMSYSLDNKKQDIFDNNNIIHLLTFTEESKKIINNYLKEKIIEPLRNNKKYQKIINPKNINLISKISYEINGDITGISYDERNMDVMLEKYNGEWRLMEEKSYYQLEKTINKLLKNIIYTEFKKHPSVAKKIYDYTLLREERNGIKDIFIMADILKKSLPILKSEKVDVFKLISPLNEPEKIEDVIKEIEIQHEAKKLIKGLLSNKYKHLMGFDENIQENDIDYTKSKNYKFFKEFVGLKISSKELQSSIGSKLSRYKTSEDLAKGLTLYINSFNNFDMDSIKKKALNLNADIIKEDAKNNNLILKINDYDASNALGSQSWCISYSQRYFDSYTRDDAKQYFVYDFNKEFDDEHSMVGITLNKKYELKDSYDKHDHVINKNFYDLDKNINIIKEKQEYKKPVSLKKLKNK